MEREPRRGAPEILGRLRRDAERRLNAHAKTRWARPAGWLIVAGILAVVIFALVRANPL